MASDVEIQDEATLTIEPGVTVRFDGGKKMQVNGGLVACGTESEPIIFTSNQPVPAAGDWRNIEFAETAIPSKYDNTGDYIGGSILQHCIVEYAGYDNTNDYYEYPQGEIEVTAVLVDRCTVRNNRTTGIYAQGTVDTSAKITYNTIHENSSNNGGGIYASPYVLT